MRQKFTVLFGVLLLLVGVTPRSLAQCINYELTLVLDNYPTETSWSITADGDSVALFTGSGYTTANDTVRDTLCLPVACYDFIINDTYGDGICCAFGNGLFALVSEAGDTVASGGAFANADTTNFCAAPTCLEYQIELVTDNYPTETSWSLTGVGDTVAFATGSGFANANDTVRDTLCLPLGCYDFIINDTYGDGICCAFGNGSIIITNNLGDTVYAGGDFASADTANFCVGGMPPCMNPVANFGYSATGLMVSFTDSSTSMTGITGWAWDFGDGNSDTTANPNHTYAMDGTYVVCLTVTDACGPHTFCDSVTVSGACMVPATSFVYMNNGLVVSFTDSTASMTAITNWLWDFGDGNTSTMQNPTHTYAADGTYTVCLTTVNACGADSACSAINVSSACTGPVADFTSSANDLTVDFTDASTSVSPPITWAWDFGDGNTSAVQSPMHTYAMAGTYTVCLVITDACDADTFCTSVTVTAPCVGPTSDFTSSATDLMVDFTDASTSSSSISAWAWDFGDGNTSTVASPTHTYAMAGTYTVCLTVTDSCSADTFCSSVTVTAPCVGPTADFTSSATDLMVDFTDASVSVNAPASYAWDFGDGNSSSVQNPMHTYAMAGTYTVCLVITDVCDADTICTSVTVTEPCVGPTADFTSSATDLVVDFTDASTSSTSISTWAWDFGDGNTSSVASPSHTYAAAGTYTVCLTVTDSCSADTFCASVTVSAACVGPTATWTAASNQLTVDFTDGSTSASGITGWSWDFGDGNTSTDQNPTHTYAADGTYTVCLTVTDSCGSDMHCDDVAVLIDGVEENALDALIDVYPNPSSNLVNIVSAGDHINQVQMFSITGKLILDSGNMNASKYSVDGTALAPGVYLIRLNVGDQTTTKRVVIQK